jgi:hypothetical protein
MVDAGGTPVSVVCAASCVTTMVPALRAPDRAMTINVFIWTPFGRCETRGPGLATRVPATAASPAPA